MPKLIAFYLPQYHEINENNMWWGKGFTDWTNVKKALPLYKNHRQPRVPYNENYYDLTDPAAQEWQSELATRYGIGGFCYYHYWFGGKPLLEKPMENMLKNRRIKIPFCVSWANEPWTRSWDGGNKKILINQEYGGETDWEKHFNYLLPFFSDPRYITIDDKPVFLIYRYSSIKNSGQMLDFFQRSAKNSGLKGLHIVSTIHGRSLKKIDGPLIDAFARFEPMYTLIHSFPFLFRLRRFFKRNILGKAFMKMDKFYPGLRNIDYDIINKKIEKGLPFKTGKPIYSGAFTGWDNTPRRGREGLIMEGEGADKFKGYFERALDKAIEKNESLFFINAWNEWAEGAYLEPDTDNGYAYLEAVRVCLKQRGLYAEGTET